MKFSRDLKEKYSPLYFFNAFVAGGLSISFFMYTLWTLRCVYSAIPSFEMITSLLGDTRYFASLTCVAGIVGFIYFAVIHFLLLHWNMESLKQWKATAPYKSFERTTDKTVLLTIPMTFAVSTVILFAALAMVLPFILGILEYLLAAVLVIAGYLTWRSLRVFAECAQQILTQPLAQEARGNNLGQMIAILSFAMQGLLFALVAGLTSTWFLAAAAFVGATLCLCLVVTILVIWFGPKLPALSESKISPESAPLFWFFITPLCLYGIAQFYLDRALATFFSLSTETGAYFSFYVILGVVSFIVGAIGYFTIKTHGFLSRLIQGELYASGLYAVLSPLLGLLFLGHYLLNIVLVSSNAVIAWGGIYFTLYVPLIGLQLIIIRLFLRLNAKLFPRQVLRKPQASRK